MPTIDLFRHDPNTATHRAGAPIFEQGSEGDSMFVVIEGSVELLVNGHVVETVKPGGIFGEMALIDHRSRSASAVAASDATIVAVDQRRFLFLIANTPYFAIEVMQVMAERLRRMDVKA